MATHRQSIMNGFLKPDANCFPINLATLATNDKWNHLVWSFSDTATRDALHGKFTVPKNYVAGAKLIIVWSTSATSGNAIWDFEYRAVGGNDTESLDQSTTQESSLTVTDAAPSAAWERMECEIALTDGNFAVDDEVQFTIYRDGASADTIGATIALFNAFFEFTD